MTANADGFPEGRSYTVIYDGACVLCRRSVEVLRTQDRRGALEYLPAQSPEVRDRFSWLQEEALLESIHLVDPHGGTSTGARALEQLVRLLPGWRRGGWVFRLPLVRPLMDRGYRWVAARRLRSGCADHCSGSSLG